MFEIPLLLVPQAVAKLYTGWMHEWLAKNLCQDQQDRKMSQKTSIFGAWVRNTFGSKAFLMATLQTGLNMMPSGAPEHAHMFPSKAARATTCLQELVSWLSVFADTVTHHKTSTSFKQARQYSGTKRKESGLTPDQRDARSARDKALRNLQTARSIKAEVDAHWNADYRRFHNPRSWQQLQWWEQKTLEDFQAGRLRQRLDAAKARHGGRVQAEPFRMP